MEKEKKENQPENKTVCEEEIPNNGKINPPERNVRKRKFTWTPKRKEAFQKCIEANRQRIKTKKQEVVDLKPLPVKQIKEEDVESVSSESSKSSQKSISSSSTSSSSSSSSSDSSASTPPKKQKKVIKSKKRKVDIKNKKPKEHKKVMKKLKSIHRTLKANQFKSPSLTKQSEPTNNYESDSESYYSSYQPSFCFI